MQKFYSAHEQTLLEDMGFHHRYYTMDLIKSYAKNNEYHVFESYMIKPDAFSFDNQEASALWHHFSHSSPTERLQIYESLNKL